MEKEQLEALIELLKRFERNEFEICVRDPNGYVRYNLFLYDIMEKYKVNIMEDLKEEIKRRETALGQLKEEKPKFDPKTLEDFQKVLYRSSSADWWRLGFFEYYNEELENKFWVVGQDVQPYGQCVPYNEETKSLVGTTEEAPEFYRGGGRFLNL